MGLSITHGKKGEPVKDYTATERLYVNADRSRIVSEDDPDVAFVLATAGKRIPWDEAVRLGLVPAELVEAEPEPEPVAVEPEPESEEGEKEAAPAEDKADDVVDNKAEEPPTAPGVKRPRPRHKSS